MAETIRVAVEEQSQIAEARRIARRLSQEIGFDESKSEQIAIVVTEACTNLLKHARGGEILFRATGDDVTALPDFEVLALDQGPGMADLNQCLRDGFSTGGSAGQGLGAIIRLTTVSDFYSTEGRGAAVLGRWVLSGSNRRTVSSNALHVGAVNVPKPGQEVCGDSWGFAQNEDFCSVVVADGLGHGMEAKLASIEAVRILHENPELSPGALVERAHQALRSTRGAALSVARVDLARGKVIFAGVGNVSAQIYSGVKTSQHLVSVNGTVGHQIQRIREFSYDWPENGMLVLHSDGLSSNTGLEALSGLAQRDPSLIAGVLYRDFTRKNDDATVVVAKAA